MRTNQRLEAIGKANELLYEQTDKMKILRSQMLYADVIHTRVHQSEEKKTVQQKQKEQDKIHHEDILRQVKAGEEAEKAKLEQQRQKIEEVKLSRTQQREEARFAKEEANRKVKDMGLQLKREAEQRMEEDIREYELKKKLSAENTLRMLKANEELKLIRVQMKEQERLDGEERNQEILRIDSRKMKLKELEKARFEKAQETRQKIIDAAVEKLAATGNTEQLILEQQMQTLQDKEDRVLAEKKARNERFLAEMAASRTEQMQNRELKKREEHEIEVRMVAKFREENELGIRLEAEKQAKLKADTLRIKKMQYDDGQEAMRRKKEEKLIEIEQARFLSSIQGNDEERFIELCKQEIERNTKVGKPVYTLLRALQSDQPQLLPATRVLKTTGAGAGAAATAGK